MNRSLFIITALAASCLAQAKTFEFNKMLSLSPTSSTPADVLRLLGKPSRERKEDQAWDYLERGAGVRVSIFFDKPLGSVESWVWAINDGDAEKDIKTAMSRFPGAVWQVEPERWAPPDSEPMECFIRDPKKGIEIQYGRVHKTVNAIWVWNPSRAVASDDDTPPTYCFGKKCSPAKLTKDILSNDPPMCELPR